MPSLRGFGFKNLRELVTWMIGAGGLGFYLIHTIQTNGSIRLDVLGALATIMGIPLISKSDERKRKR